MKSLRTIMWVLLLSMLALPALAHRFAPSLLKVEEVSTGLYSLVWKTPTQAVSQIPLRPQWPEDCAIVRTNPAEIEGTGRVYSWQLDCSALGDEGLVGQTLGVQGLGPNQASVMVRVSLLDGRYYQQVLDAETPTFVVPTQPGSAQVAMDYTALGFEHIWGGIDHLLFVFGLVLLVGCNSRLFWTITAFTLGHSVTLSLAALGYIHYPVALVEFTIAFSIFVLAVELTRSGGWFRSHPWWLAGGFGLLHGMGFAGALAETGLPEDNVPLALLFFNVGIELGQIVFILLVLLIWLLIRRPLGSWQGRLAPIPVYVLGALSAMWCIQRGLEVFA